MTIQPDAAGPIATPASAEPIPSLMRAIAQDRYGRPDEMLQLDDVAVPLPQHDQVVVRVHAASIHVGDLVAITGEPLIARAAMGLRRPKHRIPGTDVAGTVVAVGTAVSELQVGDEVFGWGIGAFAEYICAVASNFVPRPANLSLADAAAIGVSASTALQLLRDRVRPGSRVLINGASGGLGSYAVQIAVALGAEVTGVCGPGNVDVVRSLGAAKVIDYTQRDFTDGAERYDFILDNVGNHSLARTRRVLTADGVLQSNNGTSGGRWFGTMGTVLATAILALLTRRQSPPSIKFSNREDLIALKQLVEAGKVTPLIGQTYPLAQSGQALSDVAGGHARGTILISVEATEREPLP